ncbi:phage replisome organizer N-terminal domain-containing protein [Enterococcus sp. AZ072]|uniref:phage replisome organizer N-terminal domain-containing protein n=1 Tax=unclassified Enterococcus TaxID=2608891 RepID=UPI003D28CF43
MAEISWIKLKTTMFDDEKIRLIQAVPEADAILVIWIRLLVLAGKTNDEGLIYIQRNMPYTEEMLSTLFGKPVNTVRLALTTLGNFNMIDLNGDGSIAITNWEKHQNIEGMEKVREQNRLRKQKQREKKKLLGDVTGQSRDSHATDIDIDIDIDKDIKDSRKSRKRVYGEDSPYLNLAHYLYKKINEDAASEGDMTKKPNFQTWADEIRKMVELDKRSIDKVKRMIDWCQKDSFWSSNILSAGKLRAQYDTMAKKANSKPQSFSKRSNTRVEQMPAHIGKQPQNVNISSEKQAEVDRKLAEYLRQQEEEND